MMRRNILSKGSKLKTSWTDKGFGIGLHTINETILMEWYMGARRSVTHSYVGIFLSDFNFSEQP